MPYLLRLAVDAIFHGHFRFVLRMIALLCLFDDVNYVLDGTIIRPFFRAAVSLPNLGAIQPLPIHRRLDPVIGLHIERGPTKIAGRHKARINDCAQLK